MESILVVSSANRIKTARVGGVGGVEIVCFTFSFKVLLFHSVIKL